MIYLVSRNKTLFGSTRYKQVEFREAMDFLWSLKIAQFDTETTGLDAHTKDLLTIQLGNRINQVVFDWTTLTKEERLELKRYFESDVLFIGWNLMFDISFLYVQDIWPKYLWDGMIAEKLIWLGYPPTFREMSLKAAAWNYLNYDLDKTVRGKIVNDGLTEDVVVYAAGDVMWLEDIKEKQEVELDKQELQLAMKFECEFIKSLAYFKYCGVHLDINKWKAKMEKDKKKLIDSERELNEWVVNWDAQSQHKHDGWDIQHIDTWYMPDTKLIEESKALVKNGYIRYPQGDAAGPGFDMIAYRKRVTSIFTKTDLQGDLFSGFDTTPKCTINWSSSQQVIKLFEVLGINVETFDKVTKKKKKSVEAKLISPQKDKFPIIPIYLRYQEAAKVVSTYGENWIRAINPKTGRIHVDFHSLGADTARVSSGGGVYKLNLQNLPHDKETRACFTSEKGFSWISADYQSQESRIIASVSKDKAMIDIFENGCGDVHSLVAKMSYPHIIPEDCPIEEIAARYKPQRQDAKGVEFAINYGGDANTIMNNKGIPLDEAQRIYDNFMKGFPGVKQYQDYCRAAVMRDGYILLNPITKHRAHIYDIDELWKISEKFKDPEFWSYYREMKRTAPTCDTVQDVKRYFQRKSASEKQSINYRIQNRGAMMFKLASIKMFNWIVEHGYLNIVKMCVPVHDEFNLECPESIADKVAEVLVKCMIDGAKPFCPNVFLGADVDINDHWVH